MAAAVLVPCLTRGGYTATSRALFAVLAGVALVLAVLDDERQVQRLLRSPVVLVLLGLGALYTLSAAWTVAGPGDAARLGFTVFGYASLAIAAGVLAAREGGLRTCALIAMVTATATALAGLFGLAFHEQPWAERIVRRWRPGGPFEYPPALALAQVAAAPAFLFSMVRAGTRGSAAATGGGALGAAVLALSGSRTAVGAAMAILLLAAAAPTAAVGARRATVVAAAGVLAAAGAGAWAAGRIAAHGEDLARAAGLALVVAAAVGSWRLIRPRVERHRGTGLPRPALVVAGVLAAVGALAVASTIGQGGLNPSNGLAHGRASIWEAAAKTVADAPVLGSGGDAFLAASTVHQGPRPTRFAHSLPLELAAELGVMGALLALALYASTAAAVIAAVRVRGAFLVAPFAAVFPLANLLDWEWHQAGVGALWSLSLGATIALGAGDVAAAPSAPG